MMLDGGLVGGCSLAWVGGRVGTNAMHLLPVHL